MQNNLKNVKVGDTLFHVRLGKVSVVDISNSNNDKYPITISTPNGNYESFSLEGKYITTDLYPSLYLTNPFENQFQEKVMLVSNDNKDWYKRVVFANKNNEYINNEYIAWTNAETVEEAENEIYTNTWKYAKEIETEIPEYTMEELTSKLGHNFKIKK